MKKPQTLLLSFLLLVNLGFSQSQSEKPLVIKANYFDVSPPLRDMIQQYSAKADMSWKENIVKNTLNVFSHNADQPDPYFTDPVQQSTFGQILSDTTIQNFEGVGFNGGLPPDTDGDVSSFYYFQVVNTKYKIFNKSGVGIYGPFNNSAIFTGLPNNSNDGDAIVLYDENADRWLFSQFSLPNYPNGPFYQNVAISQTNDPTGSWYRYQFTFSVMPDYPKFSVWRDAYYMTIRRFAAGSGSWIGPAAVALDRTKMLTGDASASMVMFNLPSSSEGPLSLDCDSNFPPAGTPNYVSYLVSSPPQLNMYEFHVDWNNTANSTFSLTTSVPISSFSTMGSNVIPQKGTSQKLDAFSRKGLMFRMPFRKFNNYWSAVACFTVNASGKAGIRWMELRNTGSGWSLHQEGTYAPDNTNYRWMPSIAMDTTGNIALGYSISSSTMYPSIRYTGRLNNDALGTMTIAEKGIMNGGGSQTSTSGRWGDYSAMSVDPSAPGTFWYTNEYYSTTSSASWQTRIASFSIGNAFASYATASPAVICEGHDSVQLKSVAYGGSGTYSYSWTSIPAGFTSTLKEPKAAPVQDTKYIVAVSDGSQTRHDSTLTVTVIAAPYTFAGNDTIVDPSVVSIDLHGIATSYRAIQWQTTGNGVFGNNTQLNTTYTFGSVDRTNGGVSLKLIAVANPPCTGSYTSTRGIFLWPLGIQDNSNNGLSLNIQPNPARKNVSIIISGLENTAATLTLLNMNGKTVYTADLIPSSTSITKQIDLNSFAKGVYIVRLKTDRSIETKQLVVQ
ncbi:MAG: T9SS C-terminal target domain-containing protein [Bacteroidetes bacterium]|nr:MAG: T9SS C-terminal target domain-containing protein [Bacteroidota bacterium]